MILGADCTVGVTPSPSGRDQVFALSAKMGGESERAIETTGTIMVRVDRAGRVVGFYVTGAIPEGCAVRAGGEHA